MHENWRQLLRTISQCPPHLRKKEVSRTSDGTIRLRREGEETLGIVIGVESDSSGVVWFQDHEMTNA